MRNIIASLFGLMGIIAVVVGFQGINQNDDAHLDIVIGIIFLLTGFGIWWLQ